MLSVSFPAAVVLSLPAMRTVAEDEGMVQICATLVNDPAFAVLGNPIAVNFTTSDGTGKINFRHSCFGLDRYYCLTRSPVQKERDLLATWNAVAITYMWQESLN